MNERKKLGHILIFVCFELYRPSWPQTCFLFLELPNVDPVTKIKSFKQWKKKKKRKECFKFLYFAENSFPRVYKTLICFYILLFFCIFCCFKSSNLGLALFARPGICSVHKVQSFLSFFYLFYILQCFFIIFKFFDV